MEQQIIDFLENDKADFHGTYTANQMKIFGLGFRPDRRILKRMIKQGQINQLTFKDELNLKKRTICYYLPKRHGEVINHAKELGVEIIINENL